MTLLDQVTDDLNIFFGDLGSSIIFKLDGVEVATTLGLFNPSSEVASPYQAEAIVNRAEIWCQTAEVSAFNRQHTLTIDGIEYRQFGDPRPQGDLTQFILVK